jgi:hypothetical protein
MFVDAAFGDNTAEGGGLGIGGGGGGQGPVVVRVEGGGGGGGGMGSFNFQDLITPTDFWGKYVLTKEK